MSNLYRNYLDVSTYITLPGMDGSLCHISGISGEEVSIFDSENSYSSSVILSLFTDVLSKAKSTSRLRCKRGRPINKSPNNEKIIDNVLNAVIWDTSNIESIYVVINNKTFDFVCDLSIINEALPFATSGYFLKILPNFIIDIMVSVANVIQIEKKITNSADFAYVPRSKIDSEYIVAVEKAITFLAVLISFLSCSIINQNPKYKEI